MKKAVAIPLIAALAMPSAARADIVKDHPFYIAVLSVGGISGIANSIAALVYAIQDRSFHAPWIGTTMFGSAVCAVAAGALIIDAKNGDGSVALNVVGIVGFLVLSLWPIGWVTRSALSDVPLGDKFDAVPEVVEEQ